MNQVNINMINLSKVMLEDNLVTTELSRAKNENALLVFAHGAGADMHHSFMVNLTEQLNAEGISVLRFNFPYMDKRVLDGKRRPPDRMPKLIACYQAVVNSIETSLPLFIGGKSMGSRVAATIAGVPLKDVKGVLCIGYPFHPAKKPEKLRLEPLQDTQLPICIMQGERDLLGNKDEVATYDFSTLCQVHYLPDGDHDLKPRVKSGKTHQQNIEYSIKQMVTFIYEN